MKLRDYQIEAMAAVKQKLLEHDSTLVEMATGLGKTVLFCQIADEWPGKVLVIAHRDELIRQASQKLIEMTGHSVDVEMGRDRAVACDTYGANVVVGSVQTLSRANRRQKFKPDYFSLIIVDEGHHAAAKSYREVLSHFPGAKKLFVTATPKRADEVGLECVCESVAYQYGIEPAIDDGWLVPIRQSVVKIEDLDFSKARTVAEDFNQGDLERILTEEKPLHQMVASAHSLIGDRQALWFCASVLHAQQCAGVLGRYAGADNVHFLCGETPIEERREMVSAYKKGRIQHLLNCMLFLEGFDAPNTQVIVMGRPTKSLGLYMQVLGRGTRPLPGIVDREALNTAEARRQAIGLSLKPWMHVIDFAGNAGKHKIIQATDVLSGKHPEPVREYAKKINAEEGRGVDLEKILARAEAELALIRQEDERRQKIKADVKYRTYDVSPFTKQHNSTSPIATSRGANLCSERQVRYIMWLSNRCNGGWTNDKAERVTKRQARGIIAELKKKAGVP